MTWHHSTINRTDLKQLLSEIKRKGGTVASCQQCTGGLMVTWFTL